jgi:hypothetical protein
VVLKSNELPMKRLFSRARVDPQSAVVRGKNPVPRNCH